MKLSEEYLDMHQKPSQRLANAIQALEAERDELKAFIMKVAKNIGHPKLLREEAKQLVFGKTKPNGIETENDSWEQTTFRAESTSYEAELEALLIKADLRIVTDYKGRERIGTAIEWVPTDRERELIQEINPCKS